MRFWYHERNEEAIGNNNFVEQDVSVNEDGESIACAEKSQRIKEKEKTYQQCRVKLNASLANVDVKNWQQIKDETEKQRKEMIGDKRLQYNRNLFNLVVCAFRF